MIDQETVAALRDGDAAKRAAARRDIVDDNGRQTARWYRALTDYYQMHIEEFTR